MFRFTIRDLLWLTVVIAAFLAGKFWVRPEPRLSQPPELKGAPLHLARGRSGTVSTRVAVDRMSVSDPAVVTVIPLTPTRLQLLAQAKGKTTVTVWEEESGRQVSYEVIVDR